MVARKGVGGGKRWDPGGRTRSTNVIYIVLFHFKDKAVLEKIHKHQFWMGDTWVLAILVCVLLYLKTFSQKEKKNTISCFLNTKTNAA